MTMADDVRRLHHRVDELIVRLSAAGSVSPELRNQVVDLLSELDRHLDDDAAAAPAPEERPASTEVTTTAAAATPRSDESLAEQLVDAGRRFESEHPVLGRTLGNLADALSRIGI